MPRIAIKPPVISPVRPPVISPERPPVISPERPPVISPERPPVISPANAEEVSAKVKRDAQRIDLDRFMSNSPGVRAFSGDGALG